MLHCFLLPEPRLLVELQRHVDDAFSQFYTIKMGGYLFVCHVVILNLGDARWNNKCARVSRCFLGRTISVEKGNMSS